MVRASLQTEPGSNAKFDAVEQRLVDWLGGSEKSMLALLERVVNIDSGSRDRDGVNAVADCFRRFLEERGIATSTIGRRRAGRHCPSRPACPGRRQPPFHFDDGTL